MTVLIDTSVIVAAVNERDEKHDRALALIEEVREGRHGDALTTDFVLDEVVTVTLARTGRHEKAVQAVDLILPPDPNAAWTVVEPLGEEAFYAALDAFRRSGRKELSFTDWTSVAIVRAGRADAIISFDEDFDGLVARIG